MTSRTKKSLLSVLAAMILAACGGSSSSTPNDSVADVTGFSSDVTHPAFDLGTSMQNVQEKYSCVHSMYVLELNDEAFGKAISAGANPSNPYKDVFAKIAGGLKQYARDAAPSVSEKILKYASLMNDFSYDTNTNDDVGFSDDFTTLEVAYHELFGICAAIGARCPDGRDMSAADGRCY